ncbi:spore coat protein, partial [Candidatus Roizmanbacteria bacterium]|nr:spore coat protein [Candidatus Roizmanbacteria bacterium]
EFKSGGYVFAKEVPDPQRYGVIEFDENHNVISIVEKPQEPKSNYAMVGIYVLDNRASEFAINVKPSSRGEIEIPDVINQYRERGELKVGIIEGIWEDAGTFDSLLAANNYWSQKAKLNINESVA